MKSKNDKDGGNFKREKDPSNLEERGYYSYSIRQTWRKGKRIRHVIVISYSSHLAIFNFCFGIKCRENFEGQKSISTM